MKPEHELKTYKNMHTSPSYAISRLSSEIAYVEKIENEMGVSPKTGKPKTMFRPYRHMGATGIREIIEWAKSEKGQYGKPDDQLTLEDFLDDGTGQDCVSGWCGT